MVRVAWLKYVFAVLILATTDGDSAAEEISSDGQVVARPCSEAIGSATGSKTDAQQNASAESAAEAGCSPEGTTTEDYAATEPLCAAVVRAAVGHGLPVAFFTSLIWKESRLDPQAVSPRGAAGIAQFMPKTANWRGLLDPYNPKQALKESASFLRDLRAQFGNWGLAAAAYNAGPTRLRDWLNGSGTLPSETRDYVAAITGLTVEEWTQSLPADFVDFAAREPNPCSNTIVNIAAALPPLPLRRPPSVEQPTTAPWALQLIGNSSETRARAAYQNLQRKHASILGDRSPLVLRTRAGRGSASWVRIRVTESTRARAVQLCSKLKADGGICLVVGN